MSCESVEVSGGYSVDLVLDEWYFGVCELLLSAKRDVIGYIQENVQKMEI
jgi:hypothetical protein